MWFLLVLVVIFGGNSAEGTSWTLQCCSLLGSYIFIQPKTAFKPTERTTQAGPEVRMSGYIFTQAPRVCMKSPKAPVPNNGAHGRSDARTAYLGSGLFIAIETLTAVLSRFTCRQVVQVARELASAGGLRNSFNLRRGFSPHRPADSSSWFRSFLSLKSVLESRAKDALQTCPTAQLQPRRIPYTCLQ